MSKLPDFKPKPSDWGPDSPRAKVIRRRNAVLGLVLLFFVVLFFAITIVKMKAYGVL